MTILRNQHAITQSYRVTKSANDASDKAKLPPANPPTTNATGARSQIRSRSTNHCVDIDDTILFTPDAVDPSNEAFSRSETGVQRCDSPLFKCDAFQSDVLDDEPEARTAISSSLPDPSTGTFGGIILSSDSGVEISQDPKPPEPSSSQNLTVLEKIRKLNEGSGAPVPRKRRRLSTSERARVSSQTDASRPQSDSDESAPPSVPASQATTTAKRSAASKLTAEERAQRAAERLRQKEELAQAKAANAKKRHEEREQKRRLKLQEAEMTEVNRRATDRKRTVLEVIVQLSSALDTHFTELAQQCFRSAEVECEVVDGLVPELITFKRKVSKVWDASAYTFRPIPQQVVTEPTVICVLKASNLARLVAAGHDGNVAEETVDSLAKRIEAAHPGCNQVYVIEGMAHYVKTRASRAQREFANQVRDALTQSEPVSVSASAPADNSRRRATATKRTPDVNEEHLEMALQHLEVEHFAKISHTATVAETVAWILRLTEYMSLVRHSPEQTTLADAQTSFCLSAGQFTTGADAKDAYIKMLQQMGAITEQAAKDIAAQYPTLQSILQAFNAHGPLALADTERSRISQAHGRPVLGAAMSERIYAILMGIDAGAYM
ncbi:hypothetical protein KEM52_001268 [Ascosphaera acerosa]|nr:hypothetical protein KEM52_001268 [Ascosphaera acerosa]